MNMQNVLPLNTISFSRNNLAYSLHFLAYSLHLFQEIIIIVNYMYMCLCAKTMLQEQLVKCVELAYTYDARY